MIKILLEIWAYGKLNRDNLISWLSEQACLLPGSQKSVAPLNTRLSLAFLY